MLHFITVALLAMPIDFRIEAEIWRNCARYAKRARRRPRIFHAPTKYVKCSLIFHFTQPSLRLCRAKAAMASKQIFFAAVLAWASVRRIELFNAWRLALVPFLNIRPKSGINTIRWGAAAPCWWQTHISGHADDERQSILRVEIISPHSPGKYGAVDIWLEGLMTFDEMAAIGTFGIFMWKLINTGPDATAKLKISNIRKSAISISYRVVARRKISVPFLRAQAAIWYVRQRLNTIFLIINTFLGRHSCRFMLQHYSTHHLGAAKYFHALSFSPLASFIGFGFSKAG